MFYKIGKLIVFTVNNIGALVQNVKITKGYLNVN